MSTEHSRTCPFCGVDFEINQARIMSTDRAVVDLRQEPMGFGDGDSDGDPEADPTVDDDAPTTVIGAVLWDPRKIEAEQNKGRLAKVFRRDRLPLKSLDDFPPERHPRRICPSCKTPLPVDADLRRMHILAIAGVNGAGKTHFLGAAFNQATRKQGLRAFGWHEFEADAETAPTLYQTYIRPLFRLRETLLSTKENVRIRHATLSFRATYRDNAPLLVMTHDVPGEALVDPRRRAEEIPFFRRASAVVFLVDPMEFDSLYPRLPEVERSQMVERSIDQVDLLSACIRELQFAPGGQDVPLAVVVSKSDMLSSVLGRQFTFDSEPDWGDDWEDTVEARSDEVEKLLLELGEDYLVETARSHDRVTFHASSPLGGSKFSQDFDGPRPVGCLDPLGAVLSRLTDAVG